MDFLRAAALEGGKGGGAANSLVGTGGGGKEGRCRTGTVNRTRAEAVTTTIILDSIPCE